MENANITGLSKKDILALRFENFLKPSKKPTKIYHTTSIHMYTSNKI